MPAFEFAVVSALRAAQLMRGCTPRVAAEYRPTITAQLEVATGAVARLPPAAVGVTE
jgi:hypothetical protein